MARPVKQTVKETSATDNGLALLMNLDLIEQHNRTYSDAGAIKFKLLFTVGTANPINDADNAFEDFMEARAALKTGQCAIVWSEKYEAYNLLIKTPNASAFASFKRDRSGEQVVDGELYIVSVEALEDIKWEGSVVINKGTKMLRCVSAEYYTKLQKAAA